MSYQSPPHRSVAPTKDDISTGSALLTPPRTPLDEHDVPYRPNHINDQSLTMRKHRIKAKRRGDSERPAKSQGKRGSASTKIRLDMTNLSADVLSRSKSFSETQSIIFTEEDPEDIAQKLRRWTLPSKSAPTRSFTPLRSTVEKAILSSKLESPALITLQRATTNKNPRKVELTFFPEPKFSHERSGLLSYIVSTFSRPDESAAVKQIDRRLSGRLVSVRSPSVGSEGAHPVSTSPAATVCTEASVESTFTVTGPDSARPVLRCPSARCNTGDPSVEVIWDENDASTTQGSSRPSVDHTRRPSVAAAKLEAQLLRSTQTSRRPSRLSDRSSSTTSHSSISMFLEQVMTPDKLNTVSSRLSCNSSLQNLPRSKGRSQTSKIAFYAAAGGVADKVEKGHRRASQQIYDILPPLKSHRDSDTATTQVLFDDDDHLKKNLDQRSTLAVRRSSVQRTGGMVSSSSHARRRSSGNTK